MTFTLNGVGTSYSGKRNPTRRTGQCTYCNHTVELSSFDTTKVFVVLFVPLIPLGRYRILDYCPSCRRHRLIPEKEWQRLTTDALAESVAAFRGQPDYERAHRLMSLLAELNLPEEYRNLASELESKAGADGDYWSFLGYTALHFGDTAAAERYLQRSRQLSEIPWVRHSLGGLLLQQGRADEARAVIGPPDAQGANGRLQIALVSALVAAGRHEEALVELRGLTAAVPALSNDKEVKKLWRVAEKHRGTGKKIAKFAPKSPLRAASGPSPTVRPFLMVPGLVLAAFLLVGGVGLVWQRWSEVEVFVVGGLPEPYQVEVAGQKLRLVPGLAQKITLPLHQKLKVTADYPSGREESEIELDVDFGEFFSTRTVVLNPDRVALLAKQEVAYYPEGTQPEDQDADAAVEELFAGEPIYRWTSIDFPFEQPPPTIQMEKGGVKKRSHVFVVELPPENLFTAMRQYRDAKLAEKLVHRYSELLEVGEARRIAWLSTLPADRFAALAAAELDRQPTSVAWHRAYQLLPDHASRESKLVAEYRRRLAAQPDDSAQLYLLSRIVPDGQEASDLLEKATRVTAVSPWAYHGLAWRDLTVGRFEEALASNRRSLELDPEEPSFLAMRAELLLANGAFDQAVEQSDHYEPWTAMALLALTHREPEAPAFLEPYLADIAPPARRQLEQAFLESSFCFPQGFECFEEKLSALGSPAAKFWLGLLHRDAKLAREGLGDNPNLENHLLLAAILPATPEGRQEKEWVIAALAAQGFDGALAAKALRGEKVPRADLLQSVFQAQTKSLILLLLGQPSHDRELLELAARLNYRPGLGQLLLRRELAGIAEL